MTKKNALYSTPTAKIIEINSVDIVRTSSSGFSLPRSSSRTNGFSSGSSTPSFTDDSSWSEQ